MWHRIAYRHAGYARARGRNGWFVPRSAEFDVHEHRDGTLLVTLRVFSRRRTKDAPLELTLALREWEQEALAIQLIANQQRRRRSGKSDDITGSKGPQP